MMRSSSCIAMCTAVAMLACAPAAQKTYTAPTPETVYATAEEIAASPGQLVYVDNRSSVPVTVYSVTLRDCENVKQSCGVRSVNLHVNAGSRVQILRVEANNPKNAFTFAYSFGWRADSSSPAIEFVRPDTIVAKGAGRTVLQLELPDTVLPNLSSLHAPILVPIVVRP